MAVCGLQLLNCHEDYGHAGPASLLPDMLLQQLWLDKTAQCHEQPLLGEG